MNTGQKIKRYIWLVNVLRKWERLSLADLQRMWIEDDVGYKQCARQGLTLFRLSEHCTGYGPPADR